MQEDCLESTVSAAQIAASDEHHTTQRGTRSHAQRRATHSLGRDVKSMQCTLVQMRTLKHTHARRRTRAHSHNNIHTFTRAHTHTLTQQHVSLCILAQYIFIHVQICIRQRQDRRATNGAWSSTPSPRQVLIRNPTLLVAAAQAVAMSGISIANCRG